MGGKSGRGGGNGRQGEGEVRERGMMEARITLVSSLEMLDARRFHGQHYNYLTGSASTEFSLGISVEAVDSGHSIRCRIK